VKAAGVRRFGEPVQVLELPGSPELRPDEVLIEVRACGVGNWDEFVRTGDWDLGRRPPMALGVEAAGLVAATGDQVREVKAGDRVTAHSVPLREQGAWAERFVAAAGHVAVLPSTMSFDVAAALPVPALTADQAIGDELRVRAGETVLVHGAGGVTGGMLVQLATRRGATVIATAGADSAGRVAAMGASTVVDYHEPDWPDRVRAVTGGGVDAAANAARAGSAEAVRAVRDGGRLATITADLPPADRDITMRAVQVVPDGRRLGRLLQLAAQGALSVSVRERFPLERAAAALELARHGAHGAAIVLWPTDPARARLGQDSQPALAWI
jgi:NADPH:quinone reductase-like Zn-dependent oxidoreductase